jgi:hypothetical protein
LDMQPSGISKADPLRLTSSPPLPIKTVKHFYGSRERLV